MAASADKRKKEIIKFVGSPKPKVINRGARIYYGQTKGGIKAALIVRKGDQIYRSNWPTLNEANSNGGLAWPLDVNTLWFIREMHKAQIVITFNSSSGDAWFSRVSDWDDKEKLLDSGKIKTDFRGSQIKHLSIEHMAKVECAIDLLSTRK